MNVNQKVTYSDIPITLQSESSCKDYTIWTFEFGPKVCIVIWFVIGDKMWSLQWTELLTTNNYTQPLVLRAMRLSITLVLANLPFNMANPLAAGSVDHSVPLSCVGSEWQPCQLISPCCKWLLTSSRVRGVLEDLEHPLLSYVGKKLNPGRSASSVCNICRPYFMIGYRGICIQA